ncbi:MAG: hypothetical protein VX589_15160 [Myxococcota bacterium]|nr:hypothetical protein [Myxococcota bacterium]
MLNITSLNVSLLATLVICIGALGCDEGSGPPASLELSDGGVDSSATTIAFKILSPAAGTVLTQNDDEDGNPDNGVIGISVRVAIPVGVKADIELAINGMVTQTLAPSPREVTFTTNLPGQENGTYAIAVTTTNPEGDVLSDTVTVSVRVDEQQPEDCTLQVLPTPIGACDIIGVDADEDATRPLVQSTLTATTNCDGVEFTVNGISQGRIVPENGTAQLQVTFREGENTVVAVAKRADGMGEDARQTLAYSVQTTQPSFQFTGLSASRTNTFLIADGERTGGKVYWTVNGEADGVSPRTAVTIELTSGQAGAAPPVAPAQVTTDAQGRFSFDLEIADGGYWDGTLKVSAVDSCMQTGESDAIQVQLDAAVPSLRIVTPGDGTTILTAQDADLTRAGVQVPVNVEVIDVRPGTIDYEISIECAAAAGNRVFIDRTAVSDRVTRADLRDGDPNNDTLIATFFPTEEGEFICQPKITTTSNPPVVTSVVWTTFFTEPSFNLLSPVGAPSCLRDAEVAVTGFGANLDGNMASLLVQVTPDGGEAQAPVQLNALGGERYETRFDESAMPDGRYNLAFSGTIRGDIPVVFAQASRDIVVRRALPTVDILTPTDMGVFEDLSDATAGTQSAVTARVCNASGRQLEVTFSAEGFMAQTLLVDVPEGDGCTEVTTPAIAVPLGPVSITATVSDECGTAATATVSASTSAAEARIDMLADGTTINSSFDTDLNRPGCQLVVDAIVGGIADGAEIAVCTSFAQGGPGELCDMASEANDSPCQIVGSTPGGARVQCPVTLREGDHTLSVKARFGSIIESAPITVRADCISPTVRNIVVVEDTLADGCIDVADAGAESAGPQEVTVQFETSDLPNDTPIFLHTPDDQVLGEGSVLNNRGSITLTLGQGVTRFYVAGQDGVGNPLPGTQNEGFDDFVTLFVDTQTPTPSLENLSNASCLIPDDDGDPDAQGLQYAVRINTGHQSNEVVTAVMTLNGDGAGAQTQETGDDQLTFDAATLVEGSNEVVITVTDGCGNVGSINGFAEADGAPDTTQPLPTTVVVDTVPPNFAIEGLVADTVYVAEDDEDGDATNGFQTAFNAVFAGADAIEIGQSVTVSVDVGPDTDAIPTAFSIADDFDGTLPLRATISPGEQRGIAVEAVDACGNVARVEPIRVDLDIQGCASRFTSFNQNPVYLGRADVDGGVATLDTVSATIDLLDGACEGASAELRNNGVIVATAQVEGGAVTYQNVGLANGNNVLALLVTVEGADPVSSAEQSVFVDPAVPQVTFEQPSENAIISSSANLSVRVIEPVGSRRTAQLYIDAVEFGEPRVLADGADVTENIPVANIGEGRRTLRVCVRDLALNEGCASVSVSVDDGAPAAVANASAIIVDPRQTSVDLVFDVPDEDGANGGPVDEFEIRRVFENLDDDGDGIPDNPVLAEDRWASRDAERTALVVPNVAPVGDSVTVNLTGAGPGVQWQGSPPRSLPTLDRGLPLNGIYYLAIRGRDDIGNLGEIRLVTVDLTLEQTVFNMPAPNGVGWGADVLGHNNAPVTVIGDVDGDGRPDALVTIFANNQSSASVVFGGPAGTSERVQLNQAATVVDDFFAYGGAGIGDVNNDGRPDFAVAGFAPPFGAGGTAISLYFGSDNRDEIAEPDSVIYVDGFRSVVAAAGDFGRIDGGPAGIEDIFIGTKFNRTDEFAFVIGGRADADWPSVDDPLRVSSDAASNDPATGVTVLSVPDGQKTGFSVSRVGDLDGDGLDTIAFSAGIPTAVYLFDGQEILPSAIAYDGENPATQALPLGCLASLQAPGEVIASGVDLDGDESGLPDLIVSSADGKRVAVFDQANQALDCFGRSDVKFAESLSLAGDVNGDGFQDVIVSHRDGEKTDAYIFYNDGTGKFGVTSSYPNEGQAPRLSQTVLDSPSTLKLGVVGLGDFNGDTRDDIGVLVKQSSEQGDDFLFIVYH